MARNCSTTGLKRSRLSTWQDDDHQTDRKVEPVNANLAVVCCETDCLLQLALLKAQVDIGNGEYLGTLLDAGYHFEAVETLGARGEDSEDKVSCWLDKWVLTRC